MRIVLRGLESIKIKKPYQYTLLSKRLKFGALIQAFWGLWVLIVDRFCLFVKILSKIVVFGGLDRQAKNLKKGKSK